MIQIKRLKQAGSEFVPITLAEAVVVDADGLLGLKEITTLDKVLAQYSDLTTYAIAEIDTINKTYQKKLTPGLGINIDDDGVISVTTTTEVKGLSYKISDTLPDNATEEHLNIIYLIPSPNITSENIFDEYICYEDNGVYEWEKIGSIPSTISFEGLVSKEEFDDFVSTSITSTPVKNGLGEDVKINIDTTILDSLYANY